MRENSQVRISKRRQGALVRRQANLKDWETKYSNTPDGPLAKGYAAKAGVAKTDIENLAKKGVR